MLDPRVLRSKQRGGDDGFPQESRSVTPPSCKLIRLLRISTSPSQLFRIALYILTASLSSYKQSTLSRLEDLKQHLLGVNT